MLKWACMPQASNKHGGQQCIAVTVFFKALSMLLDVYKQANLPTPHISLRVADCKHASYYLLSTSTHEDQASVHPCNTVCATRGAFVDVGCLGQP